MRATLRQVGLTHRSRKPLFESRHLAPHGRGLSQVCPELIEHQRVPNFTAIDIHARMRLVAGQADFLVEIVWNLGLLAIAEMYRKGHRIASLVALPTVVLKEKDVWSTAEKSCEPQPPWIFLIPRWYLNRRGQPLGEQRRILPIREEPCLTSRIPPSPQAFRLILFCVRNLKIRRHSSSLLHSASVPDSPKNTGLEPHCWI